ncbi:hypothetical protein ACET3Z_013862 [Daucus carota]
MESLRNNTMTESENIDYPSVRDQAFDLKMRPTAYWNIILKRMVDSFALHLLLALKKLVNQGMEEEIVKEVLA